MSELSVLGVTTPRFALTVFPLGHEDIDGFEVRPAERRIFVELIERAAG